MEITTLRLEHEAALREFVDDFARASEAEVPALLVDLSLPHGEIVDLLDAWGRGERLQPGWVPGSTWFLEAGGRLLAVANLRHRLTESLERYGGHVGYSVRPSERGKGYGTLLLDAVKEKARELGLRRLLVTCAPDNPASQRVIEKCGGVFQDESYFVPANRRVRRFWIELGP
ncbi:MAG: GNAT family N-acetyltransferase [Candidatus Bipolaricaulota bacterium]|nr:MAG: GNAT family N-acetyltransferase [Candidatus Bipolaricaulota bacterium]